jgi:hypothetical protein
MLFSRKLKGIGNLQSSLMFHFLYIRYSSATYPYKNIYCFMCNVDVSTFLTRKESWSVHVSPPGAVTYYFYHEDTVNSELAHKDTPIRSHYSYELEQIATFWEDCTCSRKYFCKAEADYLIYRMRTQHSCYIVPMFL